MRCKHCKQDFDEEQMIKVGKIHYCKNCYENWFIPEVEDYNELYETFKKVKLITDDKPNVKVISYYKKTSQRTWTNILWDETYYRIYVFYYG